MAGAADKLVTLDNFTRAETDNYFAQFVGKGQLGRFAHDRELASVDHQTVVRMNRDTLYSWAVFDLDAGPVSIALPDSGGRFMSLLLIDEDHYNPATLYAPGATSFSRSEIGTRYIAAVVRTFVDPGDDADLAEVHALQDRIQVEQTGGPGTFEIPKWDQASLEAVRNALKALGAVSPASTRIFGKASDVDPVHHLIGTAAGWGGNPEATPNISSSRLPETTAPSFTGSRSVTCRSTASGRSASITRTASSSRTREAPTRATM